MASNIQRGPRRMDAGDWVRLKRLGGSKVRPGTTNVDVTNPPPRLEAKSGREVYTEFGTSKTRRPASNYIDFMAAQSVDYVLETGGAGNKVLLTNKICTCDTSNPKKQGLCVSCISKL